MSGPKRVRGGDSHMGAKRSQRNHATGHGNRTKVDKNSHPGRIARAQRRAMGGANRVPQKSYLDKALSGCMLCARHVGKMTFSVAGSYLGERAFCTSDHPKGFQFTNYWVGATAAGAWCDGQAPNIEGAAYAWWAHGKTPKFLDAVGSSVAFMASMAVAFLKSAGSAHFSKVVPQGADGTLRVMKFMGDDRPVRNIFFATTALGVVAGHFSEVCGLAKSIWNRTVSFGQASAKLAQYSLEWARSICITKTYAEGILIYPKDPKTQLSRYGYLVDGLTVSNWVAASLFAGGAKLAENWHNAKYANQNFWQYVYGQLDHNFFIDQVTAGIGLMLTAYGTLTAATVFPDGDYDITDPLFACQYYLVAALVGMYMNPLMKLGFTHAYNRWSVRGGHAHAA